MATGTPHGTTAGAGGPRGPGGTAGLPPAQPGSGWTARRVKPGRGWQLTGLIEEARHRATPAGPVRLASGAR